MFQTPKTSGTGQVLHPGVLSGPRWPQPASETAGGHVQPVWGSQVLEHFTFEPQGFPTILRSGGESMSSRSSPLLGKVSYCGPGDPFLLLLRVALSLQDQTPAPILLPFPA